MADPATHSDHPNRRRDDTGWRRMVKDNWYRDIWLLIITIVALAAILIGNHENKDRIGDNKRAIQQIQVERKRNALILCEQVNRQNAGIVAFIKASIARERLHDPAVVAYLARAARTFPQLDCRLVVRKTISKNP